MIEVESLSKHFGPTVAVRDVTFTVAEGEILGFLGPNGAGKTTTMRILTGFMPQSGGRARVDGLDVGRDSLEVRRRIGYLPESVPLYPERSVRDYLGFVADLKGAPRRGLSAALDRIMEECGLTAVKGRLVGRLSRGYRQRVGLAQALVGDPKVLVLDEPTVGLDPGQVVEVRRLIAGLRGRRTVILSTHILPEVSQVCTRVIIINRGTIAAAGTPEELTARLGRGQAFTVRLGGDAAGAADLLRAVPGVRAVILRPPEPGATVLEVEAEEGEEVRGAISRALVSGGHELLGLSGAVLSLEDIFLSLTREEPS